MRGPGRRLHPGRVWAALVAMAALAAGCSPIYVLRAAYQEARILSKRQPIAELVANPNTPPTTREKLGLVLAARQFAVDSLNLKAGDSYTTFAQLDHDTLATIVSAARKDRFEAYTWWFPIIGHVPYKGYFDPDKAYAAAERLENKGFDTFVRPTAAFSTLGWFNDPLVSPLLRYDSISLAATVIHELLHNTLYVPGQAMFNESLAEFTGSRGAILFFRDLFGVDSPEYARAEANWHDELIFGDFLDAVVGQLDRLYARTDLSRDNKLRERETIFTRAKQTFVDSIQPQLQLYTYASFLESPLNNATLISRRLYYHRLDLFEQIYQEHSQDLPATLELILDAARSNEKDPYAAVEALRQF